MLRVPQHHPGHEQRGPGSCAISERPTPSLFASSSLLCPLTPLFPLGASHSPVTPLFPLHTQKQGGRGRYHKGNVSKICRRADIFCHATLFSASSFPPCTLCSYLCDLCVTTSPSSCSAVDRKLSTVDSELPFSFFSDLLLACPPKLQQRRATSSSHSRTIGNCCPTSGTNSNMYHCIRWQCRRADIFALAPAARSDFSLSHVDDSPAGVQCQPSPAQGG